MKTFTLRLVRALKHHFDLRRPLVGAEIGIFEGTTSAGLLHRIPKLRLYMIDPWIQDGVDLVRPKEPHPAGTILGKARDQTEFARDRRVIMVAKSMEVVSHFTDGSLDFVFIDGDHRYPAVRDDIRAWWPKVQPNGLVTGHDYSPHNPHGRGVKRAVDEYALQIEQQPRLLSGRIWLFYRNPNHAAAYARVS